MQSVSWLRLKAGGRGIRSEQAELDPQRKHLAPMRKLCSRPGAYPSPFLGGVEHLVPSVRRGEGALSHPTFEPEVLLPASASITTTFGSPIRPSSLRMRDTFEISDSEKHMITLIAFSVLFAAL